MCFISFFCYFHFSTHIWVFQKVWKLCHLWYLHMQPEWLQARVAHFLRWMKFFVECCAFASKLQTTKSFIYENFYWIHIVNLLKKKKFAPKKFNIRTLTLPKWTYKVENMDSGFNMCFHIWTIFCVFWGWNILGT